jgi:hypothetical protein
LTTYLDIAPTITSGTTAATFGTGQNLTLNAKARRVIALVNSGCDTVYTTAEGSNIILRIDSSSLGLSDQRMSVGPYITSGPATNSSGQSMAPEIFPLDWECFGNEVITLSTALTATNTTGKSNLIGLEYVDTLPPADWIRAFPDQVAAKGGYVASGSQLTTTRTALTAINIPTWVSELTSMKAVSLKTAAITAGQYEQLYMEVTSSIPDITPMKIMSNSDGSTLGTPVGTGLYHEQLKYTPIYIRNVGGAQTITPYVNLTAAVSTGNAVSFGVNWR